MEQLPHLLKAAPGEADELCQFSADSNRLAKTFRRLDASEARLVRRVVNHYKDHARLHPLNRLLNLLGNGWLYLPVALLVPVFKGSEAWRFMLPASVSVVVAHSLYSLIKLRIARARPYDLDPTLGSGVRALDRYSCPSGHCMTAAAVGVPLAVAFPATLPAAALVWLLVAWSRISLGHHYPTDLILGGLIGASVGLTASMLIP